MNSPSGAFNERRLPFIVHRHSSEPSKSDTRSKGMLVPDLDTESRELTKSATYPRNAHLILVSDVNVFNGNLQIVNDFCSQGGPQALLLRRFI